MWYACAPRGPREEVPVAMLYLKEAAKLALDADRCTGCGMCTEVCPHGAFVVEDAKARIVDRDLCMECGACALNCPAGALTVESGVGCACAVIKEMFRGAGPDCCSGDKPCC